MPDAKPPRLYALVPCAGRGSRAATAGPKQYERLGDRSVVGHTLAALQAVPRIAATLVVLDPDDPQFEASAPGFAGHAVRCGGATRAESVTRGLDAWLQRGATVDDWVLVHDAARCLLRPQWVDALIDACIDDPVGGLLALPVADTLKRADDGGSGGARVAATVDRASTWQAQTPQMFRIGLLRAALAHAARTGTVVTDESSAVEALGHAPRLVRGSVENLKLTFSADFEFAARWLREAGRTAG